MATETKADRLAAELEKIDRAIAALNERMDGIRRERQQIHQMQARLYQYLHKLKELEK